MAVTTPVTYSLEERTWRAIIETPRSQPYTLSLFRERRNLDSQGNVVGDVTNVPVFNLNFTDIVAETVTVPVNGSPLTLTVSDVANFLIAYFDQKATALEAVKPAQ